MYSSGLERLVRGGKESRQSNRCRQLAATFCSFIGILVMVGALTNFLLLLFVNLVKDPFNIFLSRTSPMLLSQILGRFNLQRQGQVSVEQVQIYPKKIILDY